jgi:hypothetical protein
VATTNLLLVTGEALELDGSLESVAKQIENATRSSAGALAWFTDSSTGETIAINPAHVVTIKEARS